jgi:hypothetical protein
LREFGKINRSPFQGDKMAKLICLERHSSFVGASRRARALAMQHKKETFVRRGESGWEVFGSELPKKIQRNTDSETEYSLEEDWYGLEEDRYVGEDDGERTLLLEEIASDQDDWARSEEEGWYYAD